MWRKSQHFFELSNDNSTRFASSMCLSWHCFLYLFGWVGLGRTEKDDLNLRTGRYFRHLCLTRTQGRAPRCLCYFKHSFRAGDKWLGSLVVQYSCLVSRLACCLEINLFLVRLESSLNHHNIIPGFWFSASGGEWGEQKFNSLLQNKWRKWA